MLIHQIELVSETIFTLLDLLFRALSAFKSDKNESTHDRGKHNEDDFEHYEIGYSYIELTHDNQSMMFVEFKVLSALFPFWA